MHPTVLPMNCKMLLLWKYNLNRSFEHAYHAFKDAIACIMCLDTNPDCNETLIKQNTHGIITMKAERHPVIC